MGSMGEELQILRVRDEEATRLQIELDEATASTSRIQKLYQEEQASWAVLPHKNGVDPYPDEASKYQATAIPQAIHRTSILAASRPFFFVFPNRRGRQTVVPAGSGNAF